MTEREQKIKDALNALEGALKYAKHQYEYSKEPVTHGDLIAPILTAMIVLCDLQKESPRPDWTPCAEGLPTESGVYGVTWKNLETDRDFASFGTFDAHMRRWDDQNERYVITAWMPKPTPYRADQKEDNADDHK